MDDQKLSLGRQTFENDMYAKNLQVFGLLARDENLGCCRIYNKCSGTMTENIFTRDSPLPVEKPH